LAATSRLRRTRPGSDGTMELCVLDRFARRHWHVAPGNSTAMDVMARIEHGCIMHGASVRAVGLCVGDELTRQEAGGAPTPAAVRGPERIKHADADAGMHRAPPPSAC
jgi:hypothetical protein